MRFALHLFALFVAVSATAASLVARQTLPTCAVPCLTNANTGTCTPNDDTCLCNDAAFINSTTACIMSACSGSDLTNAEAYAQALCNAVGVTLTVSSASATGTTTSAKTSTSSTSSATPTTSSSSGASMTSTVSVLAGAVAVLAIAAVL